MQKDQLEKYRALAVDLTARLIQAPSVSGQEEGTARTLAQAMKDAGFDEIKTDRNGNVTGFINGKRPGPTILLDGHMDTVPVPDQSAWSQPPFEGRIVGDRLYGRGTSDMKGALAAMVAGSAAFAEATGRDFAGRICVAGITMEELFEGVSSRQVSSDVKPDVVVIGEATELKLNIGQRGRAEIVVTTQGVPAHSANPEKGVNAVLKMVKLLAAVEERMTPSEHPVLGKGIAVCTDILSTPYPGASVVPSQCKATFDRRILVGESADDVLAPFKAVIKELSAADPTFKAEAAYSQGDAVCYTKEPIQAQRFFPAWLYEPDAPFVKQALAGLKNVGQTPELSHYSFCTNGSHYAGEAEIPTIGYGPSRENLAHTIDEYVELEQLHKATEGYLGILSGLLQAPID